jgi:hypothetical protein
MTNIPERDIPGHCEGEFRDRVREGEDDRQKHIAESGFKSADSFPNAPGAKSRNDPPGWLGGHV